VIWLAARVLVADQVAKALLAANGEFVNE